MELLLRFFSTPITLKVDSGTRLSTSLVRNVFLMLFGTTMLNYLFQPLPLT